MNKLLTIIFFTLFAGTTLGQRVYSPSVDGVPGRNQPVGISGLSLDGRSMYHDTTVSPAKWRDFQSTAEVLAYFNTATKREGHFIIYIHSGGSLSAGVWAGGTTVDYHFIGPNDQDLVIKGGGADRQSARVFYLSKQGAVSDALLGMESATFGTDNTAAVQTVLDNAVSGPIEVVVDGRFSITQLKIRSNTKITVLPSCGFIQRDNSNKIMITNYNKSGTAIIDSNIVINGGVWNGNGQRGGTPYQTKASGVSGELFSTIFRFAGIKNSSFSNLTFLNPRIFVSHFSNWSNINFENISITLSPTLVAPGYNYDGLKFVGPGRNLNMRNISGQSGDDLISVCSNDGFQSTDPSGSYAGLTNYDLYASYGDIRDVYIDGVTLINSKFGLRLLSTSNVIDRVYINNIKGEVGYQTFIIDNYSEGPSSAIFGDGSSIAGKFKSINISDVNVNVTTPGYKHAYFYVAGTIDNLDLRNIERNDFSLTDYPTVQVATQYGIIKHLKIDGLKSIPSQAAVNNFVQIDSFAVVDNLDISNVSIQRRFSPASVPLVSVQGGTVNNLKLNGVYVDSLTEVVKFSAGALKNIVASNIIHNGNNGGPTFNILPSNTVLSATLSNIQTNYLAGGHGGILKYAGDAFPLNNNSYVYQIHNSTFTASNGTNITSYVPEVGNAWSVSPSAVWEIQSGRAVTKSPIPGSTAAFAFINTSQTDYRILASINKTSATGVQQILFRYTDENNFVVLNVSIGTSFYGYEIYNVVSGVPTKVADLGGFVASGDQLISLTVSGNSVSVNLNASDIGIATIPTLQTGTKAGIGYSGTATAGIGYFNSFEVYGPSSVTDITYNNANNSMSGTLNFGTRYNTDVTPKLPAITLFDGGSESKYGIGMNNAEVQMFLPTFSGQHFSWNKGGSLQSIGTNEIMRLDQAGKLGIGTISPAASIHVKKDTNAVTNMIIENLSTGGNSQAEIKFTNPTGSVQFGLFGPTSIAGPLTPNSAYIYNPIGNVSLVANSAGGKISFSVGTVLSEKMRLDSNGVLKYLFNPNGSLTSLSVPTKGYVDSLAGGGASLPSQTGQSGKYLTTNGATASWGTPSGSGDASTTVSSSTDNTVVLFNSTTGKSLKPATVSGVPFLTSGVLSTIALGANGTYLKVVGGVPAFVSDSALIPTDGSLDYSTGVLGVNNQGTSAALYKSVTITSLTYTVGGGVATVLCSHTGGTMTLTLPSASTYPDRRITIKNISTNNVTIANSYSGDPNTMNQYNSYTFQSISGVWYMIHSF